MTNWKTTLNITVAHDLFREGKIEARELAARVLAKVKKNQYFKDESTRDLIAETILEDLEALAENSDTTADDYDCVLNELYNYADEGHKIWVKTV